MTGERPRIFRPSGYALAGAIVCFAGAGIAQLWVLIYSLIGDFGEGRWQTILGLFAPELLGLYFFLEWRNRRVVITPNGIEVRRPLGGSSGLLDWKGVSEARFVLYRYQEGAYEIWILHGAKVVARIPDNISDFEGMARLINRYVRAHGGIPAKLPRWCHDDPSDA